jgi:predicted alpha/beta hydrolase family esterase
MKANLLIVHGAGVRSFRIMSEKWVPYIKKQLGPEYHVVCPEMPNPQFPQYALWREKIKSTIAKLKGPLILVGHSLGGTLLLKYISEEKIQNQILGLYFIASPYFSEDKGWNYQDFFIHKSPNELLGEFPLYSYHSTDDAVVPVSHQGFFAKRFPQTIVRTLSGHGHEYNMSEFKEIIQDIRQISRFKSSDQLPSHS